MEVFHGHAAQPSLKLPSFSNGFHAKRNVIDSFLDHTFHSAKGKANERHDRVLHFRKRLGEVDLVGVCLRRLNIDRGPVAIF